MSSDQDCDPDAQARMESYGEQQDEAQAEAARKSGGFGTRSIELTQHMLGLNPYVLIQAVADEDDELALRCEFGGAKASLTATLPLMAACSMPAETNELTRAVTEFLAEPGEHPDGVRREVLAEFAEFISFPMPGGE